MAESERTAKWLHQLRAVALEQSFELVWLGEADGVCDCIESFSS